MAILGMTLIIGGFLIYPHIRGPKGSEISRKDFKSAEVSKGILILGLLVSFASGFFDGAESMVSSVLIGDEIVDSSEYIAANALIQLIITVLVWIYLSIGTKKPYNPFRKTEKNRCISQSLGLFSDVFYVFALSSDALLGIILWNVFPILDIVGARIFFKEKLSRVQYLVLSMIIVGAVFISLS
jgi:drug/metabolite transporter (DMT)-like permease